MFPGWPPILYVYLGPVSKGVCQKKKKKKREEQLKKKKKLHRYVLRDIHKKTRKKCVLNVKYITVHYIVIKHIFLTSLFLIQSVLFGTYGFYNNRNACLTFLLQEVTKREFLLTILIQYQVNKR